jgi:hypothetical protein
MNLRDFDRTRPGTTRARRSALPRTGTFLLDLEQSLIVRDALQVEAATTPETDAGGQGVGHCSLRSAGEEDLASVRSGTDPGDRMHGQAT